MTRIANGVVSAGLLGCVVCGCMSIETKAVENLPEMYLPSHASDDPDPAWPEGIRKSVKESIAALEQGDVDEARDLLGQALGVADLSDACRTDLHVRRGLLYWEQEDYRSAIEEYTIAATIDPHSPEPVFHRWMTYMKIGDRVRAERDRSRGKALGDERFSQSYAFEYGWIPGSKRNRGRE